MHCDKCIYSATLERDVKAEYQQWVRSTEKEKEAEKEAFQLAPDIATLCM